MGQKLVTNNPKVLWELGSLMEIDFVEGDVLDVLYRVRDYIHEGAHLLSHPFAGSMKPNQTPCKSILLGMGRDTEAASVEKIELCIETTKRFLASRPLTNWDAKTVDDFRTVDLSIITGMKREYGMNSCRA